MQLSTKTIQILENWSNYNRGIVIRSGNQLRSISSTKSCAMSATVDETFPRDIAIADIISFLHLLRLFNNPEIDFGENEIVINESNSRSKVRYLYANERLILTPPSGGVKVSGESITFNISEEELGSLIRGVQVLKKPEVRFQAKDGVVTVSTYDVKDEVSNTFSVSFDAETGDFEADLFVPIDNLKVIKANYEVTLSQRVIQMKCTDYDLVYWIGPDPRSKWS